MFAVSRCVLRLGATRRRGAGLTQLKHRLKKLKASNDTAQATLAERRRLAVLSMRFTSGQQQQQQQQNQQQKPTQNETINAYETLRRATLELLPRNPSLEAAIAFVLHENGDARAELEFTRQLLNSTLISLASPVSAVWDPYDVKPQVFALDTYLALPVFTSLEYLELFCRRFAFAVRDPSGTLWADGTADSTRAEEAAPPLLLPDLSVLEQSEWWQSATAAQPDGTTTATPVRHDAGASPTAETRAEESASDGYMSADALFEDVMSFAAPLATPATTAKKTKRSSITKRRRHRKGRRAALSSSGASRPSSSASRPSKLRRRRRRHQGRARRRVKSSAARASASEAASSAHSAEAQARREVFMQRVAAVTPFGICQATPLPTFGPLVRPFFVGYFADVNTLLHNAAIVPDKVDLVVNPGSPIEFVLAREATNRILHKDQLLLHAYQRVERTLQHEFSGFFARYCPGVRSARSACVPRPLDYATAVAAVKEARRYHTGFDEGDGEARRGGRAVNPLTAHRERTRVLRESEYSNGVVYELVILLDCEDAEDLAETYRRLQEGKHRCLITGHADLDVLPTAAAAPAVQEAAKLFYERDATAAAWATDAESEPNTAERRLGGAMGIFRVAGQGQTINTAQPADSYFHDPTNAYTEAHAVFTEELKLTQSR